MLGIYWGLQARRLVVLLCKSNGACQHLRLQEATLVWEFTKQGGPVSAEYMQASL